MTERQARGVRPRGGGDERGEGDRVGGHVERLDHVGGRRRRLRPTAPIEEEEVLRAGMSTAIMDPWLLWAVGASTKLSQHDGQD